MGNIINVEFKRNDIQSIVDEIKSIIYQRSGSITVAEAIGLLEIVKQEILSEQP